MHSKISDRSRFCLAALCLAVISSIPSGHSALPPEAFKNAQDRAGEHLDLQVLSANVSSDGKFRKFISAEAQVLKVHRSKTNLSPGQVIDINYENYDRSEGRPGWSGPQDVPILKAGEIVEAWLDPEIASFTYRPAASGGSFLHRGLATLTNSIGMKMIPLPNRYPQPHVYLAATEVTREQYASVIPAVTTEDSKKLPGNLPQVDVSLSEAKEFCKKLTEKEHAAGKLPTEYEYRIPYESEWMAAYQSDGDFLKSPLEERAWFIKDNDSEETAQPVATLKPNRFGWYDLDGNVMEWCSDVERNADGTDYAALRSDRLAIGGSFGNLAEHWISGPPTGGYPLNQGYDFIGFRVVLAPINTDRE